MAARNRPPDIQETFRLYLDASERFEELMEEVMRLRRAGKIGAAKRVEAAAKEIRTHLEAIEEQMKPTRPGD